MDYGKDFRQATQQVVELSRFERQVINRRAKELAQLAEIAYREKLIEIALLDKDMDGAIDLMVIKRSIPEIDSEMGACAG
ncbi:hypothetical protein [Nitrosomonas sp.]|uniref:hypothetical protein n=1 Tax=Nitrosomonas sp. TaxID=42353 RepID=UPI0037C77E9E